MNTTAETSKLTSLQINMAPTTTLAKSKKGVAVLAALCLLCFSAGRLSTSLSGGGGASLEAALLRGSQHDVVRGDPVCTYCNCDGYIYVHEAYATCRCRKCQ